MTPAPSPPPRLSPSSWYRIRDLEELLGREIAARILSYEMRAHAGAWGRDVLRAAASAGITLEEAP